MVSCKFIGVGDSSQVKSLLFTKGREFVYKTIRVVVKRDEEKVEEELPLKIYVEDVAERKSYLVSNCYIDFPLELYRRDVGSFTQVVSAPFELQLVEDESPPLLIIYARKDIQTKILGSLKKEIDIKPIIFELAENFDKIRSSDAFQEVRQLRLIEIQDTYLDTMIVTGRRVHHSPLVRQVRENLGGRPNSIAVVFRSVWVLISRDARMFTPVPEKYLPGGREEFFLLIYRRLKEIGVVKIQEILV